MAVALSTEKQEYILDSDKELDEKNQTTFFIKPLSARQFASTQDKMKISSDTKNFSINNIGSYTLDVLQMGLVGWQNFVDASGTQIKWHNKDMESNLDRLFSDARFELSTAIMDLSNLKESSKKN